jgi:hypothetical protein
VTDRLIELSRSDSVTVRQEAVAALGLCRGSRVLSALQLATRDISQSVREAAMASLERITSGDRQESAHSALT